MNESFCLAKASIANLYTKLLVLFANIQQVDVSDWQNLRQIGTDGDASLVPLVVLGTFINDIDKSGSLESSLSSVNYFITACGKTGTSDIRVQTLVDNVLPCSVGEALEHLELVGFSAVSKFISSLDFFHEILSCTDVLGPSLVFESLRTGYQTALLRIKVAVHKDGIDARALIRINPVFTIWKLGVGHLDFFAGTTRSDSLTIRDENSVPSIKGNIKSKVVISCILNSLIPLVAVVFVWVKTFALGG